MSSRAKIKVECKSATAHDTGEKTTVWRIDTPAPQTIALITSLVAGTIANGYYDYQATLPDGSVIQTNDSRVYGFMWEQPSSKVAIIHLIRR